jgi:hypothetical protein
MILLFTHSGRRRKIKIKGESWMFLSLLIGENANS